MVLKLPVIPYLEKPPNNESSVQMRKNSKEKSFPQDFVLVFEHSSGQPVDCNYQSRDQRENKVDNVFGKLVLVIVLIVSFLIDHFYVVDKMITFNC